MGQSAHLRLRLVPSRAARRVAIGTAASVAAALTVSGCAGSLASATTTLHGVIDVTVVHRSGIEVAAVEGLRLHTGDLVRTGPGGRADLVTRSRHVYLGSEGSVQVLDGAHQSLRHGVVVVDAQHGPGLDLQVAGLRVTADTGTATRAERSVTMRIASLAGDTHVVSSTGRSLTVRALHQVIVGGDALPDATTPLRLTDDDGEARAVPDLVRDDHALLALARGIDQTGAGIHVTPAGWLSRPAASPAGVARSEQVLPVVIATAGPRRQAPEHYRQAVSFRTAGGSWAVVAHLLDVRASGVLAALAALERTQPAGRIGDVRAIAHNLGLLGGPPPSTRPGGHSGGHTGGPTGNGSTGTSSPSPSPGPGQQVTDTVDNTVNQVLSVVPTPTPTPSLPAPLTSALPLP